MFKKDWEKTSVTHKLPEGLVEKMLKLAYPNKKLISSELISGGCANLNIKIIFEKETLLLRIYLRDKTASYREQNLYKLLSLQVPLPTIYFIGDLDDYRFAICEFIEGTTLRDLLLSDIPYDLSSIMGLFVKAHKNHNFPKNFYFEGVLSDFCYKFA